MPTLIEFFTYEYDESIREELGFDLFDVVTALDEHNDEWLDGCHNYIQWIFPTKWPSKYNPDAPLLTDDDINLMTMHMDYRYIRETMIQITNRMIVFWKRYFKENGCKPMDHNYLRITRALECAWLLKCNMMRYALKGFIDRLYNSSEENKLAIGEVTYTYWMNAYNGIR